MFDNFAVPNVVYTSDFTKMTTSLGVMETTTTAEYKSARKSARKARLDAFFAALRLLV